MEKILKPEPFSANLLRQHASAFFEHWAIYRKVIEHDYMGHAAIRAAMVDSLRSGGTGRKRLLELGCGDADTGALLMTNVPFENYHGVDLAGMALKQAEIQLRGHSASAGISLHREDILEFLSKSALAFDVILAGYALHHLRSNQKLLFFSAARDRLAEGGELFVYDTFPRRDDNRTSYLNRYLDHVKRNWTEITTREFQLIEEHVRRCDFPVTMETLLFFGIQAGFQNAEVLWSDGDGERQLVRFGC